MTLSVSPISFSKVTSFSDTSAEIDLLVYKLYGLSWAEVKIVDPEFGMSEEAYNKYIL